MGHIDTARVLVDTLADEPAALSGGFKRFGAGRESGGSRLEAFREPKAILGV